MPEHITGQLLYEALETGNWTDLSDDRQSDYNQKAGKLNQLYLAPLQGLARDWLIFLQEHEELDVLSAIDDDWRKTYEELKKRSTELLGEEQKG